VAPHSDVQVVLVQVSVSVGENRRVGVVQWIVSVLVDTPKPHQGVLVCCQVNPQPYSVP
jgi:hypothetical protein